MPMTSPVKTVLSISGQLKATFIINDTSPAALAQTLICAA
jgi:hypothetical protein